MTWGDIIRGFWGGRKSAPPAAQDEPLMSIEEPIPEAPPPRKRAPAKKAPAKKAIRKKSR